MDFEWDRRKSTSNLKKHKVSFELAQYVFSDPNLLSQTDDRTDYGEERWIAMGAPLPHSDILLVVAYTYRKGKNNKECIRIISARRATAAEKRFYYD